MSRVCIIAEAGVNHNGSLEVAKKMAYVAKEAGADIVKFQTFNATDLVTSEAKMAPYQIGNMGIESSQFHMLKELMLSRQEFIELKKYCEEIGIDFLSTPFDIGSIEFLEEIGCKKWKIPSGEITNYPYLLKIAKTGKPIIMSTGMCYLKDVTAALKVLRENMAGDVTLLHCTTDYPTQYDEVNLRAMLTMKNQTGLDVGYSDHTLGTEVAIAAVSLGATVIEKHFTLSRSMQGPDHKASLEPDEFKMLVKQIRNIERALGQDTKEVMVSERENLLIARKSIVAKRNIIMGETFSEFNLTTKRPGTGISPMRWLDIIGKKASRNYKKDELIDEEESCGDKY